MFRFITDRIVLPRRTGGAVDDAFDPAIREQRLEDGLGAVAPGDAAPGTLLGTFLQLSPLSPTLGRRSNAIRAAIRTAIRTARFCHRWCAATASHSSHLFVLQRDFFVSSHSAVLPFSSSSSCSYHHSCAADGVQCVSTMGLTHPLC